MQTRKCFIRAYTPHGHFDGAISDYLPPSEFFGLELLLAKVTAGEVDDFVLETKHSSLYIPKGVLKKTIIELIVLSAKEQK